MAQDIIQDPLTKAQFSRDTSVPGSKYAPYDPSSLKGTMTTGGQTTPPQTSVPAAQPQQQPNLYEFSQYIDTMRQKVEENNVLATTRNTLLNSLYNRPPTQEELNKLDPSTQQLLQSGDKSQVEMQIRLLNDKIQGRTGTLDQSIQYLTSAYEKSLAEIETQKKQAEGTLQSFLSKYGSSGIHMLYGTNTAAALEAQGFNLKEMEKQATLAEQKQALAEQKQLSALGGGSGQYRPIDISRYALAATRIAKNFLELPAYKLLSNAGPMLARIEGAISIPGSVSDNDLLDSVIKLNTGGQAITEAQVNTILKGRSFADEANVWRKKLAKGGVLSDDQRKQLINLSNAVYKNYQKLYQPVYDAATKKLESSGIPEEFWTIPDLNALSDAAGVTSDLTGTDYSSQLDAILQGK